MTNLPAPTEQIKNFDVIAADVAMQRATSGEGQIAVYADEDICAHWGITLEQLAQLKHDPKFAIAVSSSMHIIKRDAPHLATKARMILELTLDTYVNEWLKDDKFSLGDKNKLLDNLIKIAGLIERYKAQEEAKNPASEAKVPSINITLTTVAPSQAIVEKVVDGHRVNT